MKVVCYTCTAIAVALTLLSIVAVAIEEIVASRVMLVAVAVLMFGAWQSSKRVKE